MSHLGFMLLLRLEYADTLDSSPDMREADQQVNISSARHTDHSYDQIPAMGSIL